MLFGVVSRKAMQVAQDIFDAIDEDILARDTQDGGAVVVTRFDYDEITESELEQVAEELNRRSRILGYGRYYADEDEMGFLIGWEREDMEEEW